MAIRDLSILDQIFNNVDVEKTENNVRNYFSNKFPQLVMKAGYSMSQLKSPVIDDMPSSTPYGNTVEKQLVAYIDARLVVIETIVAIDRCPIKYQRLLRLKYIDELPNYIIMERLGYEKTQYYENTKKAYIWFANSFERTMDLHVYKTGLFPD
ncbi:ArpU family phage packaging/lysis transcriptional regulator [Lactobacillus terrae]|uniref:ArpU family phage packaging/lysis transcriptional regulator n=1 Tax=Lactobacillus terrae TaxID=2269374 RepID=UPI0014730E8C|nr:ArpU family phage packaging/lysis transcriptional regulator [Lactobacillus terrae]